MSGFTLIEMAIVLVIICLIVGGILTGQSLIEAATIRAQISQIEKYNQAVNTFYNKYGGLPGDLPSGLAGRFGFYVGGNCAGQSGVGYGRNGNGVIDSAYEPELMWLDLSQAGLIDQNFNVSSWAGNGGPCASNVLPNISQEYPDAKLSGNTIIVGNGGEGTLDGNNWYTIATPNAMGWSFFNSSLYTALYAISAAQASAIDRKIDDGLPITGNVVALGIGGAPPDILQTYEEILGAPTDNGTTLIGYPPCFNTTSYTYALTHGNAIIPTCELSIKMQAGD